MIDAPVSQPDRPDVDEIWSLFELKFSNLRGMQPGFGNLVGVSNRTYPKRVSQLEGRKAAAFVREKTQSLSRADLNLLLTKAIVNQEQAVAALRLTLIANVTIPLGGLLAFSQVLPEVAEDARLFLSDGGALSAALGGTVVGLVLLALWYVYAGVAQARDLLHILKIEMARRGEAGDMAMDEDFDMPMLPEDVPGPNGMSV